MRSTVTDLVDSGLRDDEALLVAVKRRGMRPTFAVTMAASHKLLIGHHGEPVPIPGVAEVIRETRSGKQASLMVRTAGPADHPEWTVRDVTLEDLVLAYLAVPGRQEVAS